MKTLYKMLCGAIGASLTFLQLINSCIPTLAVSLQGENVECAHDIQCICDDFCYEQEDELASYDIDRNNHDEYTLSTWYHVDTKQISPSYYLEFIDLLPGTYFVIRLDSIGSSERQKRRLASIFPGSKLNVGLMKVVKIEELELYLDLIEIKAISAFKVVVTNDNQLKSMIGV